METHRTLQLTKEHYNDVVLKTYIDWCSGYNTSAKGLQMALTSRPLQNYFFKHYRDLEIEFKSLVKDYEGLDKKSINEFYADVTNKIFTFYPSALLPQVKSKEKHLSNQN